MKIKISYQAEEAAAVAALVDNLRKLLPGVKVHESKAHEPFFHVYLSRKK